MPWLLLRSCYSLVQFINGIQSRRSMGADLFWIGIHSFRTICIDSTVQKLQLHSCFYTLPLLWHHDDITQTVPKITIFLATSVWPYLPKWIIPRDCHNEEAATYDLKFAHAPLSCKYWTWTGAPSQYKDILSRNEDFHVKDKRVRRQSYL